MSAMPAIERAEHGGARPAELGRRARCRRRGRACRRSRVPSAGQVERPRRAVALGQPASGQREQGEADRHVEPEDPVPRDAVDDAPPTSGPSATPRPEMPDHAPIARPRRSAGNASASRVSVSGVTMAAPTPWTARAAISAPVVGARAAAGGGDREDGEADEEHAAAAEAVAERGAGEQQDRVGERVRVDRPLERLDRRAEVGADGRQGVGDDEVVEHDHEEGDRDDRESPPGRVGSS